MTQCQVCQGRSTLYLCPQCTQTLKGNLTKLAQGPEVNGRSTPGLLANLADVEIKHTRMGGGSGHRKRGDEMPAPFVPDVEKLDKNGRIILSQQGKAVYLLTESRNKLSTIIRSLCESRGVEHPHLPTTGDMATWLASEAHAIACDEDAGVWFADIDNLTRRIERAIDRPEPPRFCGPCPTYIEDRRDNCGRLLYVQRTHYVGDQPTAVTEAYCSGCRSTHSVATLVSRLENRADVMRFTAAEILTVMLTLDMPIPERTWRRWRKEGRVKIRGYKRPDNEDGTRGRVGDHRRGEDDEPVYRLSEIKRIYAQTVRHADAECRVTRSRR